MKKSVNSLRLGRTLVAIVVFSLLVGLFADYGQTVPAVASWLAKVQIFPAAMAFSLATFVIWLIVTLLFGRIYCSTFCPLGIYQDLCSRLPRMRRRVKPRWHYHYSLPHTSLRHISLFIVVLSIFLGISAVTSFFDPYSVFGRFGLNVVRPIWGEILNAWYEIEKQPKLRVAVASGLGISIAVVTMLIVGLIAFLHGRTLCNSVCPVGTTLSFVSKYSIFHIDINTDKCIQCRKCEHRCKSSCIDLSSHVVDTSRCVVCFDCLSDCPNDAISYTFNRHQLSIPLMQKVRNPIAGSAAGMQGGHLETVSGHKTDKSEVSVTEPKLLDRRKFLTVGAVVAAAPMVAKAADALASVSPRRRMLAVPPPGVRSRREFLDRCTSCGLCISHCPQGVLKASLEEYGLLRALHPVKDYDLSWCIYDCTRCADLCPTGALHPLTISEKRRSRVGLADVDRSLCISYNDGVNCGACSRRCPADAISMTPASGCNGPLPVVDASRCIGCGACQYVCPSRPKAIVVNGIS